MKALHPLKNLVVVDLSRTLPGPYCSALLAHHGAKVVQVDAPGTKTAKVPRLSFASLEKGKQRVELNLKEKKDRAKLTRLLEKADVFLEGFRPGVAERLGIGFDALHQTHPDLIYCSISGYGHDSERRLEAGHDINYMATSGILSLLLDEKGTPHPPGIQIADLAAALYATIQIVMALRERDATGEGRHIDISITDCAQSLALVPAELLQDGEPYGYGEGYLSGGLACYDVYRARDGKWLAVGALEKKFFANLCRCFHMEEAAEKQFVPKEQDGIRKRLAAIFAKKTSQEWTEFLSGEEVCVCPVRTLPEALLGAAESEEGP